MLTRLAPQAARVAPHVAQRAFSVSAARAYNTEYRTAEAPMSLYNFTDEEIMLRDTGECQRRGRAQRGSVAAGRSGASEEQAPKVPTRRAGASSVARPELAQPCRPTLSTCKRNAH